LILNEQKKINEKMKKISVTLVNENLAHARNGEVVLYKRGDSKRWQARFKLKDLKWHRVATKHVNIQFAAETACEAYDRARFLYDEKIPITSKRFDSVADIAVDEMERQLKAGVGKSVYNDYISVIKKYLKPFFGAKAINTIGYEEIKKYSDWRTVQMKKPPVASTVTTHISAFNRVFDCAVERGWIAAAQVPKMKNNGEKGVAREAFSLSEYKSLTSFMPKWAQKGHTAKTREMRELLRDYVLILVNTGMRHGTETKDMKWRDIEWITKDKQQYLQITVTGKVGKRQLIARHNTEDYLKRIQQRQSNIAHLEFDTLLKRRLNEDVFKLRSGGTTANLSQTFNTLMRDSGLDADRDVKQRRSLYSLRHTYAHLALLKERMDVYTLAKQMGTSVKMIEQHYGHLQPSQKADVIAGKRMSARKTIAAKKAETTIKLKVVK
jgi:integrase